MGISKKKIEELMSAAEKIIATQSTNKKSLLFELTEETDESIKELSALLEPDALQDPEKSYDLFYNGIQKLLLSTIPADNDIRGVILELKTILLSGKEKQFVSYGKRGADSRMSQSSEMESVIDILTEWCDTPYDFFKLAILLLNKNKELNYVPQDRELCDYMKK